VSHFPRHRVCEVALLSVVFLAVVVCHLFSSRVLTRYLAGCCPLCRYDFHKTVQDPSHGEFKHEYFKKDRPDLLPLIKRKVGWIPGGDAHFLTLVLHTKEAVHRSRRRTIAHFCQSFYPLNCFGAWAKPYRLSCCVSRSPSPGPSPGHHHHRHQRR
jgi:hypothetical protein